MKSITIKILGILITLNFCLNIYGQPSRYINIGFEQILSFSASTNKNIKTTPRFSSVPNIQFQVHRDFSTFFGVYSGLALRNIGMSYSKDEVNTPSKYKLRTYTLGLPIMFKLGNIKKRTLVFMGGELELPWAFKSKILNTRRKEIYHEWFSNLVSPLLPAIVVGLQMRGTIAFALKYYLINFFQPAASLGFPELHKHRIFYFSLTKIFPGGRHTSQPYRPLLVFNR